MLHGPLDCDVCFPGGTKLIELDGFRLVNDPGWWGAADPVVLILGQSKGNTQTKALQTGEFEKVGFAGVRDRLARVLDAIGVPVDVRNPDRHFLPDESDLAFASLLRCSLSYFGGKTSGSPIVGAMQTASTDAWIRSCMSVWLRNVNRRLRVVVLLGLTPKYVKLVSSRLRALHPSSFRRIADGGVMAEGVAWVFAQHPSRISENHYRKWISQDAHPRRDAVRQFVEQALVKNG